MVGAGSYLPSNVMTNDDLSEFVETDDSWIKTANRDRPKAHCCWGKNINLAAAAAGIKECETVCNDIDIIIITTTTPDDTFPSTASVVQHKLKAYQAFAFDVQAVCAGFVYGLGVGDSLIKSGQGRRALIIGAESFTKLLNWKDRTTCVLFGDGAGAVILDFRRCSSGLGGCPRYYIQMAGIVTSCTLMEGHLQLK